MHALPGRSDRPRVLGNVAERWPQARDDHQSASVRGRAVMSAFTKSSMPKALRTMEAPSWTYPRR